MATDGVFSRDPDDIVWFHAAPTVPPANLLALLATIARRMHRLLARRGISEGSDGVELPNPIGTDAPTLTGLAVASGRGVAALGARAGRPARRWGDDCVGHRVAGKAPRSWHARSLGFDLHSAVSVRTGARDRIERLCGYALRPAEGQDRLHRAPDG
jgi:hypothetical protein